MNNEGRNILEKLRPKIDKRLGFHFPPFISVDHLHLHCFALPIKS